MAVSHHCLVFFGWLIPCSLSYGNYAQKTTWKYLEVLRLEPMVAGLDSQTLPLCYEPSSFASCSIQSSSSFQTSAFREQKRIEILLLSVRKAWSGSSRQKRQLLGFSTLKQFSFLAVDEKMNLNEGDDVTRVYDLAICSLKLISSSMKRLGTPGRGGEGGGWQWEGVAGVKDQMKTWMNRFIMRKRRRHVKIIMNPRKEMIFSNKKTHPKWILLAKDVFSYFLLFNTFWAMVVRSGG